MNKRKLITILSATSLSCSVMLISVQASLSTKKYEEIRKQTTSAQLRAQTGKTEFQMRRPLFGQRLNVSTSSPAQELNRIAHQQSWQLRGESPRKYQQIPLVLKDPTARSRLQTTVSSRYRDQFSNNAWGQTSASPPDPRRFFSSRSDKEKDKGLGLPLSPWSVQNPDGPPGGGGLAGHLLPWYLAEDPRTGPPSFVGLPEEEGNLPPGGAAVPIPGSLLLLSSALLVFISIRKKWNGRIG